MNRAAGEEAKLLCSNGLLCDCLLLKPDDMPTFYPHKRYSLSKMRTRLILFLSLVTVATKAQAQATTDIVGLASTTSKDTHKNIARIDWGTVLGYNLSYNFWQNHGFVFPVLASYERYLGSRWSIGGEALINGGDPTQRRSGAGISTRYYMLPLRKHTALLAGGYVSPVIHYRALRTTEGYWGDTPATTYARRLAPGLMLGWQMPIGSQSSGHFTLDFGAGAYYQVRVGTDRVDDPYAYYSAFSDTGSSARPGFMPDVRLGVGYQF